MKRTPLKRKTTLRAKTPINKVSKRQAKRNRELAKMLPPEDGKCQKCQKVPDFRGLSKHHVIFRSRGGTDEKSNLLWLCGTCHDAMHGIIDR